MKDVLQSEKIFLDKNTSQYVLPGWETEVANALTQKKREILETFFTNINGQVTAIRGNMPPVMAAALTARFSRAQEFDITELFWKEFIESSELGKELSISSSNSSDDFEKILASEKSSKIIRRILDQFGDDSVREQASGYVMIRGASVLTSMEAFRNPLITGIEASTRYINFAEVSADQFCVFPENITSDPSAFRLYRDTMIFAQESYKQLWPVIWDYIVAKNPKDGVVKEIVYKTAIKGAVCDVLRGLLPLGVKTNFGIHANYRAMTESIMNLRASGLAETVDVANKIALELSKINPEFTSVVDSDNGQAWTNHRINTKTVLYQPNSFKDLNVDAHILNSDWESDLKRALGLKNDDSLEEFLVKTGEARGNRRHKMPEEFDTVSIRVKVEGLSFGAFKDINRHRKLQAKTRPDWSGDNGYVVPDIISEIGGGVQVLYEKVLQNFSDSKKQLENNFPYESRLLLAHGTKTAYEMVIGLGEFYWISELRSIASGNPEYRNIANMMYNELLMQAPILSNLKTYVNPNEYSLNRIGEAIAIDNKISK